jgi:hypothetical protein
MLLAIIFFGVMNFIAVLLIANWIFQFPKEVWIRK